VTKAVGIVKTTSLSFQHLAELFAPFGLAIFCQSASKTYSFELSAKIFQVCLAMFKVLGHLIWQYSYFYYWWYH